MSLKALLPEEQFTKYLKVEDVLRRQANIVSALDSVEELVDTIFDKESEVAEEDKIPAFEKMTTRVLQIVMKKSNLDEPSVERSNQFIRRVIDLCSSNLAPGRVELVELLAMTVEPDTQFYRSFTRDHQERTAKGIQTKIVSYQIDNGSYMIKHHLKSYLNIIENPPGPLSLSFLRNMMKVILFIRDIELQQRTTFGKLVTDILIPRILQMPDAEMKHEDKNVFYGLYFIFEEFIKYVSPLDAAEKAEIFKFDLSIKLLRSPFLERRIQGVSDIRDIIELVSRKHEWSRPYSQEYAVPQKPYVHNGISESKAVTLLVENGILEYLFGEHKHVELLKRCLPICTFLIQQRRLTDAHLRLMWEASVVSHETTKVAILKIMSESVHYMNLESIRTLWKICVSQPVDSWDSFSIDFIRDIAYKIEFKKTNTAEESETPVDEYHEVVKFMWDFFQDGCSVAFETKISAFESLFEILHIPAFETNGRIVMKWCLQNIAKDQTSALSAKLLQSLIQPTEEWTRKRFYEHRIISLRSLSSELDIIDIISDDCAKYQEKVLEALQKSPSSEVNIAEACLVGRVPHRYRVFNNLDIITKTMEIGCILSSKHINQIWDAFVVKSICPTDENNVYSWLSGVRIMAEKSDNEVFSSSLAKLVFDKFSELNLTNITLPGYVLFQSLFDDLVFDFTGQMALGDEADSNVHGLITLWLVATQCENAAVSRRATQKIINFYKNPPSFLDVSGWTQMLIKRAMMYLNSALSIIQSQTDSAEVIHLERRKIIRIVELLKVQLEGSTTSSISIRKRHGAYDRGQLITINLLLAPEKISVSLYTKDTIDSLKKKAAALYNKKPGELRVIFSGRELKQLNRLISQENIMHGSQIHLVYNPNALLDNDISTSVHTPEGLSEESTPEYLLSQPQYFHSFLNALGLDEKISESVWPLLMLLPTDQKLLEILEHPNIEVDWANIFDSKSIYKLFYSLQIVDMLVQTERSKDWVLDFTSSGGMSSLLDILNSVDFITGESNPKSSTCLGLLLKTLNILILGVSCEDAVSAQFFQSKSLYAFAENALMLDGKSSELYDIKMLYRICNSVSQKAEADLLGGVTGSAPSIHYEIFVRSVSMILPSIVAHSKKTGQLTELGDMMTFLNTSLLKSKDDLIRDYSACFINVFRSSLAPSLQAQFDAILLDNLTSILEGSELEPEIVEQYFDLFMNSIKNVSELRLQPAQEQTISGLGKKLMLMIYSRPIYELRQLEREDNVIVGLMKLLSTLFTSFPKHLHIDEESQLNLIGYLFNDCLFCVATADCNDEKSPPKCKTKTSRREAFRLLYNLSCLSEQNLELTINLTNRQHHGGESRHLWSYLPSNFEKASCGFVGLKNQGATCYMNSLVQQLYMIPKFRHRILEAPCAFVENDSSSDESGDSEDEEPHPESTLHYLKVIFSHLMQSEKKAYDTKPFCDNYRDCAGEPINTSIQMDVVEFFNGLFDNLENQLKGKEQANTLKEIFGGVFCNQIISKECEHVSEREEPFYLVSVDVNGKSNLSESLESFIQGEMLDGSNKYFCEKCNKKVDALKRCCISELPNTLTVHLKRFEFDFETMRRFKLNSYLQFPTKLDMQPYTKEGISFQEKSEERMANPSVALPTLNDPSYYEYQLTGVLVHMGTADSGHYYSYIQNRNSSVDGAWYMFNDSVVEKIDERDIEKLCFGGTETTYDTYYGNKTYPKSYSAYILFYERKNHIEQGLQIQFSPKDLIPKDIYESIWSQNTSFLRERNLFDEEYFDFIWSLTGCPLVERESPGSLSIEALKMFVTFIVEVLSHAKEKAKFPEWIKWLRSKLASSFDLVNWIVEQFANGYWLDHLFLNCVLPETRSGFSHLLLDSIKLLCDETPFDPDSLEHEQIVDLIAKMIKQIPDLKKYWKVFAQFFEILRDFAAIGDAQKIFLLQGGTLKSLLVLFELLEKQAADMELKRKKLKSNDKPVAFDFKSLSELYSILVRSVSYSASSELSPNKYGELVDQMDISFEFPPEDFMARILKLDSCCDAIIDIFCYISWDNPGFERILKPLTSHERIGSCDERKNYFQALNRICLLNDKYQKNRLFYVGRAFVDFLSVYEDYCTDSAVEFISQFAQSFPSISKLLFENLEKYIYPLVVMPDDSDRVAFVKLLDEFEYLPESFSELTLESVKSRILRISWKYLSEAQKEAKRNYDEKYPPQDYATRFSLYFNIMCKSYQGTKEDEDLVASSLETMADMTNAILCQSHDLLSNYLEWTTFLDKITDLNPSLIRCIVNSKKMSDSILSAMWTFSTTAPPTTIPYIVKLYNIIRKCSLDSDDFSRTAFKHNFVTSLMAYILGNGEEYGEVFDAIIELVSHWSNHEKFGYEFINHFSSVENVPLPKSSPVSTVKLMRYYNVLLKRKEDLVVLLKNSKLNLHMLLINGCKYSKLKPPHKMELVDKYFSFVHEALKLKNEGQENDLSRHFSSTVAIKQLCLATMRILLHHPVSATTFENIVGIIERATTQEPSVIKIFLEKYQYIEDDRHLSYQDRIENQYMKPTIQEIWRTNKISEVGPWQFQEQGKGFSDEYQKRIYGLIVKFIKSNLALPLDQQLPELFRTAIMTIYDAKDQIHLVRDLLLYIESHMSEFHSQFDLSLLIMDIVTSLLNRQLSFPNDIQLLKRLVVAAAFHRHALDGLSRYLEIKLTEYHKMINPDFAHSQMNESYDNGDDDTEEIDTGSETKQDELVATLNAALDIVLTLEVAQQDQIIDSSYEAVTFLSSYLEPSPLKATDQLVAQLHEKLDTLSQTFNARQSQSHDE